MIQGSPSGDEDSRGNGRELMRGGDGWRLGGVGHGEVACQIVC